MKFFKTTKPLQAFTLLLTMLFAILTSSCSELEKAAKKPISEQEACNRLQGLIADHPNKFKKYKKSLRKGRNLNTWSADQVFPMAENCQVWEWSTGLYSYICNWQAENGLQSAKSDYEDGNRIIQSCLGNAWQSSSDTTKSGGQRTVYKRSDSHTIVSIRYFQESRSIIKRWFTVVTIGDESNLKAQMN